jgi:glycolate oxidase
MSSDYPLYLARRAEVAAALLARLPARCVLSDPEDTRPYECDGLAAYRQAPMIVTLPDRCWRS